MGEELRHLTIDYGGSSMLANMAAIGFVLNVVKRQQRTVL